MSEKPTKPYEDTANIDTPKCPQCHHLLTHLFEQDKEGESVVSGWHCPECGYDAKEINMEA